MGKSNVEIILSVNEKMLLCRLLDEIEIIRADIKTARLIKMTVPETIDFSNLKTKILLSKRV